MDPRVVHERAKTSDRALRRGLSGEDVRVLQGELTRLGLDVAIDGSFGEETEGAVMQVQTMFGFTVDGVVDASTRQLIRAQVGYGFDFRDPSASAVAARHQRRPESQRRPGGASNVRGVEEAPTAPSGGTKGGGGVG